MHAKLPKCQLISWSVTQAKNIYPIHSKKSQILAEKPFTRSGACYQFLLYPGFNVIFIILQIIRTVNIFWKKCHALKTLNSREPRDDQPCFSEEGLAYSVRTRGGTKYHWSDFPSWIPFLFHEGNCTTTLPAHYFWLRASWKETRTDSIHSSWYSACLIFCTRCNSRCMSHSVPSIEEDLFWQHGASVPLYSVPRCGKQLVCCFFVDTLWDKCEGSIVF